MKNPKIEHVDNPDIEQGHFNQGEHLFVEIEPGQWQTISAKLPNGKHVTFAFVPGSDKEPDEIECVDIHCTVAKPVPRPDGDEGVLYPQHFIGFSNPCDTFDTRKIKKPTFLATLLLHRNHYEKQAPKNSSDRSPGLAPRELPEAA